MGRRREDWIRKERQESSRGREEDIRRGSGEKGQGHREEIMGERERV